MTELSKKIIHYHLVRKTAKQKQAFREMLIAELKSRGIEAHEETHKGMTTSVNVVAGDAETAELVFCAHYDTCPRMFLPNFIAPCNQPVYFAYQIGMVLVMLALAMIPAAPIWMLAGKEAAFYVWYFAYLALLFLMLKGPANPSTMNDNTSGVVGLIELMERLPEPLRSRCAFVFFDNEELHMLGSSAFRKAHKEKMKKTPLINLDCIGEGDYLLLAANKAFRADEALYGALKAAFAEGETTLHRQAEKVMYPSDQKGFEKSLAIAALKKARLVGYYMDKIHTPKDTVLEEKNIERIASGLNAMSAEYLK